MKKIMVFIVTGLFFVGMTSFTLADDLMAKTMANETVGHVKVNQKGSFVLRMGFFWGPESNYQKNDSQLGGDQLVGQSYTYKLGSEYGITNGSTISPRFYVVSVGYASGGGLKKFVYEEGNPKIAEYTVWGSTGDIKIDFDGILTP